MDSTAIIAEQYAATARGDVPGMLRALAPDIRWTEAAGSLYAGTFVGPEAVLANVFGPIAEQWDGFAAEVESLLDAGDHVVALGYYSGTHRRTGRRFRARMVHIWRVADGLAVEFEQVVDSALMNAAALDD